MSRQSDLRLVALVATFVSTVSFIYFFRTDQILLYGDAVAHINIARRVFDSQTPGLLQLGTVWLPLPHLLMMPFLLSDSAWRNGAGGSVPSMVAFVLGAVGMYRLTASVGSRMAAWIASLAFTFNPNLIYMQSTAMTECMALATMIWAMVYLIDFAQNVEAESASATLRKAALILAAGILVRYDGWFFSACAGIAVLVIWWRSRKVARRLTQKALIQFLVLCAVTPALWFAFNYEVYGNALEFMNGPYSAQAIAARSSSSGGPPHPGYHRLTEATVYFQKSAKLNLGEKHIGDLIGLLALVGAMLCCGTKDKRPVLLLWAILPFYALSIAYGGVPIFMPQWWPHSYYNVRYGLQLLPAILVSCALLLDLAPVSTRNRKAAAVALALTFAVAAATVWRNTPICLREARVNSKSRIVFETNLAATLSLFPPQTRFLMYTGDHSGVLQRAGIAFKRVLNESNWPIWEDALNHPAGYADIMVAMDNDPLGPSAARNRERLEPLSVIHTAGQPTATIYRVLP